MIAAQAEFLSAAPPMDEAETPPVDETKPTEGTEAVESHPESIETTTESETTQPPEDVKTRLRVLGGRLLEAFKKLRITVRQPKSESEADGQEDAATSAETEEAEPEPMANARDFNPLPPEPDKTATSSEEIFAEIGKQLHARREMLSLTFEEIERHIRVRGAFLAALEKGALDELPSPVQTRGILANYAGFLDLDVDAILLRFADGIQARYLENRPLQPKRSKSRLTVNTSLPPFRSFIASDLIFGGGVALLLLLFAIWGIGRVVELRSTLQPEATSPSISDVLAGTSIATPAQQVTLIPAGTQTPAAEAANVTPTELAITFDPNIKVQLSLDATERTYMRVIVDGEVQFEGRTLPGSSYPYQAQEQIEVLTGNAAALKVTYNGRDLGLMGNFGEVVDRVYSVDSVGTPTSTAQPTATATPEVTSTPTRTQTPTSTPSVTPTSNSGG